MDSLTKDVFKRYYDYLNNNVPKSIECLDFINHIIVFMFEIYNDFNLTSKDIRSEMYLTKKKKKSLCMDILRSINIEYSYFYNICLEKGLVKTSRVDHSYTNSHGMHILRTNVFDEVLTTVHEFAHYLHLKYRNPDPKNLDWWHSTETIAMTFEFYALFYMAKIGILSEDVKKSYLLYMEHMYVSAYNTIGQSLALTVIDKYGDLRLKDIEAYKNDYGVNNYYINYIAKSSLDDLILKNKYRYTNEYRYLFGLPLAIYMGNRMATSYSYKEKFIENLPMIGDIGSDGFFKRMNAYQIFEDEDKLYQVMGDAYIHTKNIIENDEFKPKMIRFKR